MTVRRRRLWGASLARALASLIGLLGFFVPAHAEVSEVADRGFVVRQVAEIPLPPSAAWELLVRPDQWWSSAHTFSGDAANLSLDQSVGGCFCEVLRDQDSLTSAPRGGVEHMRVIFIERDRMLRMSGGLGPLQSEAVVGTLTIQLKPDAEGTRILLEYAVSGFMRTQMSEMAPLVDAVLSEQLGRLANRLNGELVRSLPGAPSGALPDNRPTPSGPVTRPDPLDRGRAPSIRPIDPDAEAGIEIAPDAVDEF